MYKQRIKVFAVLVGLALLVLIGKLGYLQIVRGTDLRRQYEESTRKIRFLPAMRGQIMDRKGRILAVDKPAKRLCLEYRFLTNDPKWVAREQRRIARDAGLSRADANQVYRRRADNTWKLAQRLADRTGTDLKGSVADVVWLVRRWARRAGTKIREEDIAHPIVTGLGEDLASSAEAEINGGKTVGAVIRPDHKRYYPYGGLACHTIGVIGRVTSKEMDRLNLPADRADWLTRMRRNYRAQDTIGKTGVEKMCETLLAGRRGYRVREYGGDEPIDVAHVAAAAGKDVHLTLDVKLQEILTERMLQTGRNGAAVVVTVRPRTVLAMVSVPVFNLNRYPLECETLFKNVLDLPLLNRAVAGMCAPGSSVKPLVALAGLATGKMTEHTTFECRGSLLPDLPDRWRCTGRHGEVAMVRAIMKSCNVFFYRLGSLLGAGLLGEWMEMFGLGAKPGTGLPEERSGVVPTAEWLRRKEGRGFRPGDARQMAIGQGYILASPLQVANAMATIADGGRFRTPILTLEGGPRPVRMDLPVSAENLRIVHEGMEQVVHSPGGTGYKAFRDAGLGVKVCGKSGTAQVPGQWVDFNRNGTVDLGEVVRRGKMAWFVGFAPRENPKVAFAVVVEYIQQGGGGSVAGPIAVDVLRACQGLGYLD